MATNSSARVARVYGDWYYTCLEKNPDFNSDNPTPLEEDLYNQLLEKEFIKP